MTPAARTQAAIELLDLIIAAARDAGAAADTLVARYFAERRYAGSKDRRAVRELVYDAIRLAGERPESGRAAMLLLAGRNPDVAAMFDGSRHGPAPIASGEAVAEPGVAPHWLEIVLEQSGIPEEERAALVARAPLDVRINRLRAPADLPAGDAIPGLPDGLRLAAGTNVDASVGAVEVQDAGSQFVTLAAQARPGMTVVDLCAGGGGKTLALASAMENQGRIIACDVDRSRLSKLPPRAERAGVTIAEMRLLDPGREVAMLADLLDGTDAVLVDAPCTGTGTWRRNPEARWRLTPARIERRVATQAHVLDVGAALVRPGGTLTYVVCSLLDAEGAGQVEAFLARHPGWTTEPFSLPVGRPRGPGLRLTPHHDGTDGFFVARLIRPC
ncbi:RsmB/NOP family class I SAM-dependent RNA methyltransferase [Sphingomonas sp. DT-204]|uniref:RsmB/NOP family class I SAM-dependent RNA methyltransferase n=1 Tax=Sphingomonas sp. DT-204 TaxID=3396166 RepID=UPI003F1D4100